MTDGVTVEVEGARQLRSSLKRAGVSLEDLKDANAKVAQYVAALAKVRAPKRSGKLASTIKGNRAANRARVSAGRAAVPYAGPIHWGWPSHHIKANPFMADAAQSSEAQWSAMYMADVQKIIDKIEGV